MGETAAFTDIDGGNGDSLYAQNAALPQAGTLQSLSFYVAAVSGDLRLGIYDASGAGGGPGQLLAQTGAFTPKLGWNTQVVTPAALPVGNYWLAYTPSSGNLNFPVERDHGLCTGAGRIFAPMPPTFPATSGSGQCHWSFYATLSVP